MEATGDDLGQFLHLAHPHHGDYVGMTGYGVGLSHSLDGRHLLCQLAHSGWFGIDEHKCGDHASNRSGLRRGFWSQGRENLAAWEL